MDTSGFYKKENDYLLYGNTWIQNKDYTLVAIDKDKYVYPIDGWSWFDDAAAAYTANGLPIPNSGDIAIQAQIASDADWGGFKSYLDANGIYEQMLTVDFSVATDAFQAISFILGGIEVVDNIRQINIFYQAFVQKSSPELVKTLNESIARFNIPINI
jgi:hypothetical protein